MTKTPETTKTAIAHGNYVRGSASKVRRVLDQIRGRSYSCLLYTSDAADE